MAVGKTKTLLMMIRLAFDDGTGAVDLLCEHQTNHLMRERHFDSEICSFARE